jgi:hypothetical protein
MAKWVKVQDGIDCLSTKLWRQRAYAGPPCSPEEDKERVACRIEAVQLIGRGLTNGTLVAAGICADGSWENIDPRTFVVARLIQAGTSYSLWSQDPTRHVALFSDIAIDANTLERLTPGDRRLSTAGAEAECRKWLSKLMRENPHTRILKSELQKQAAEKWGKALSGRSFNNAYRTVKSEIMSPEWRARGPLKKKK